MRRVLSNFLRYLIIWCFTGILSTLPLIVNVAYTAMNGGEVSWDTLFANTSFFFVTTSLCGVLLVDFVEHKCNKHALIYLLEILSLTIIITLTSCLGVFTDISDFDMLKNINIMLFRMCGVLGVSGYLIISMDEVSHG